MLLLKGNRTADFASFVCLAPQEILAAMTETKRELACGCGFLGGVFLGVSLPPPRHTPLSEPCPQLFPPHSITTNKPTAG